MYRQTLGPAGSWIFLLGAFAVLYSTFFVATASNARLFADALTIFGLARYANATRAPPHGPLRLGGAAGRIGAGLLTSSSSRCCSCLIGALGQGLMLPFLGGVAVYFHHRRLAQTLHRGPVWTICLWLSALAMALVGLYQVAQTFVFS